MREDTLPLSHFEQIYARGEDPWHFADSAYEHEKYAATLQALPQPRYANAFEVGCSIGVLTGLLAERCDSLLAVEPVEAALEAARYRNAEKPWVRFAPLFIPRDWPEESFDLVVLSEVLDYLGNDDLAAVADRLHATLRPGGDVLLVHWVGKKGATARPGESSDGLIEACSSFARPLTQHRNAAYRLDCLRRYVEPSS